MSDILTEHNLFKPKPSKAETRADITSQVARAIISAEAERREAKTARLRQARLEAELKAEGSKPSRRDKPVAPGQEVADRERGGTPKGKRKAA